MKILRELLIRLIICSLTMNPGLDVIAQQNFNLQVEKTNLEELEYNWLKAEFALDTVYLSKLIDQTFMSISANGVKTKHQSLLAMHTTIATRQREGVIVDSFKLEDVQINIYDSSAAVVTFVVHTYGKNKGKPTERRTRFYDVWIRRGGQWKAVSSQGTRVGED